MRKLSDVITFFKRNYSDVLGLDIGTSGTKAVRIKRIRGVPTVVAVDILPVVTLPDSDDTPVEHYLIPKELRARYAAIAISKEGGIVKLLTFPAHSGKTNDEHVQELMGLGEESRYRLGYESILENRTEVRVLASALPDAVAVKLCQLLPVGVPAPCSIEVAGLASLTAYSHFRDTGTVEDCSVLIDFGAAITMVAFFNKNTLALVRRFDFGAVTVLKKLQDSLGVEQDVALGILNDGSFDVTKVVHQAMESFLQQLIISWDFVERRENIHIGKLYMCGGGVGLNLCAQEMESATGQVPIRWDPFEGLAIQPGAFPEKFKGQETRFSAAIGAALAMLKVS